MLGKLLKAIKNLGYVSMYTELEYLACHVRQEISIYDILIHFHHLIILLNVKL